jgi:fused signal recognition particle receptor
MMDTTETVLLVSIFALATVLIALPRALGRRKRRARGDDTDAVEPDAARAPAGDAERAPAAGVSPPAASDALEGASPTAASDAGEEEDAPRRRRRLRGRLKKSRAPFAGMRGRMRARRIDDDVWDELEETLLLADAGIPTTARLVEAVRARAIAEGIGDADALPDLLEREIALELHASDDDRALRLDPGHPNVWLLVGVNGAGKTTTAAKLAARAIADGHSVLLAAADTFRAAAADQLAEWGDRLGVEVIRGQEGGDPGAVAFDAVQAAAARQVDLVLVDTAGRLHTKVNLMAELEKVRRVVERTPDALAEVLLVLDATTGQNGLAQARQFGESIGVTGVVLTKLDGSAKGGVVMSVESELDVPVKLVGVGESADDLVPFDPDDFAAALVGRDSGDGELDTPSVDDGAVV